MEGFLCSQPAAELDSNDLLKQWNSILKHAAIPVSARHTIFTQGTPAQHAFLVESGLVMLQRFLPDGCGGALRLAFVGEWVGEGACMLCSPHETTAVALTECRLKRVGATELRLTLSTVPAAATLMLTSQAWALHRSLEALLGFHLLSARERFRELLSLLVAQTSVANSAARTRIPVPLTDSEIAELIGVEKRHFLRIRKQLDAEGGIRWTGGSVVVRNINELIGSPQEIQNNISFFPYLSASCRKSRDKCP